MPRLAARPRVLCPVGCLIVRWSATWLACGGGGSVDPCSVSWLLSHHLQRVRSTAGPAGLRSPVMEPSLAANGGSKPPPLTTLNAELASIAVENGCSDDRIMCR
uniref:Secreted protein n=1 Tax=Knipowitschia caucasica TaxID=637954 RepID=A0AAV2M625_KNICA